MELFKIMLAGDVSTGKTSFLTQLIYQTADRNPKPNHNLSFFAFKLTNPSANIQLWDSPGDPRFHYQVVSSLTSFKVLLAFVDVTNSHTLDCARTLTEQIRCYPQLQVHIVESKEELTRKDQFKRKVTKQELQELADLVGGCVFQYTRNQPVQPILHKILTWQRPSMLLQKQSNSTVEANSCQCQIF